MKENKTPKRPRQEQLKRTAERNAANAADGMQRGQPHPAQPWALGPRPAPALAQPGRLLRTSQGKHGPPHSRLPETREAAPLIALHSPLSSIPEPRWDNKRYVSIYSQNQSTRT